MVTEDGVRTRPLNLPLCPWVDHIFMVVGNKNDPLSNEYPSPIEVDGTVYPNVAQAFAHKLATFHNRNDVCQLVLQNTTHAVLDKHLKDVDLSSQWYACCVGVMKNMLSIKFQSCPAFAAALRASQNKTIVYPSTRWGRFWGSGWNKRLSSIMDPKKYPGRNHLGVILMELRGEMEH
jgi:ribA/ribD-fused uncharacterized protein